MTTLIQDMLQRVGGIENYGLISIGLFLLCFLGIVIWAFCLKKARLEAAARLPLEEDPPDDAPEKQEPPL